MGEPGRGLPRFLIASNPGMSPTGLSPDGRLDWSGKEGIAVFLQLPDGENALACPCCKERERPGRWLFKSIRLGAPFLLQTAIPALLRHMRPFDKNQEPLPYQGRRLITFTDSRQGTARFAVKIQQEAERNYVRSLLYHRVAGCVTPSSEADKERLRTEIATLEPLAKANPNPVLQGILEKSRQDLEKLETPQLGRLKWISAIDKLLVEQGFNEWLLPPLREQTFG
ncbi:MAG: hypothetical protein ACREVZ_11620, partial [Burkholderiales bacterium]